MSDQIPGPGHLGYPADPLDSFGRLNAAQPYNIFDAQFNYDLQPSLFDQYTVNGGIAHVPSTSSVRLSTGGGDVGDRAIFQSRRYFRYQPGKAHNVIWTCVLGNPKVGVRQVVGIIDDDNGLAFVQNAVGLGILRRTSTSGSPADNITYQSEWNLDRLDGEGRSAITLDPTKNNIFLVDCQWLGAGRVRWGFDFGGHITYCHQSQWANTDIVPFMRTANLPFRAEIENIGAASGGSGYDFTCVAISSNGGSEPFALMRSASNVPLRNVSSTNDPLPVVSIRPRATFGGLTNRGQVIPVSCQIASKDAPVAYAIIQNGILTGASFSDVNTLNSLVEIDVAATGISGGIVLATGYLGAGVGMPAMGTELVDFENVVLSNNIPGDSTEMLSVVFSLTNGASSDCAGSFIWKELR